MIKELCTDTDILTTPAQPATAADADLAQDLVDTLASLEDAACLAANQIGQAKALCALVDARGRVEVMYNPHITMAILPTQTQESCLTNSTPIIVKRFGKIKVRFERLDTKTGELSPLTKSYSGWEAQMVQHMCDHIAGKLV